MIFIVALCSLDSTSWVDREIATRILVEHAHPNDVAGVVFSDPEAQRRIEYIQDRVVEKYVGRVSIYSFRSDPTWDAIEESYSMWYWGFDWPMYGIPDEYIAGTDFLFNRVKRCGLWATQ